MSESNVKLGVGNAGPFAERDGEGLDRGSTWFGSAQPRHLNQRDSQTVSKRSISLRPGDRLADSSPGQTLSPRIRALFHSPGIPPPLIETTSRQRIAAMEHTVPKGAGRRVDWTGESPRVKYTRRRDMFNNVVDKNGWRRIPGTGTALSGEVEIPNTTARAPRHVGAYLNAAITERKEVRTTRIPGSLQLHRLSPRTVEDFWPRSHRHMREAAEASAALQAAGKQQAPVAESQLVLPSWHSPSASPLRSGYQRAPQHSPTSSSRHSPRQTPRQRDIDATLAFTYNLPSHLLNVEPEESVFSDPPYRGEHVRGTWVGPQLGKGGGGAATVGSGGRHAPPTSVSSRSLGGQGLSPLLRQHRKEFMKIVNVEEVIDSLREHVQGETANVSQPTPPARDTQRARRSPRTSKAALLGKNRRGNMLAMEENHEDRGSVHSHKAHCKMSTSVPRDGAAPVNCKLTSKVKENWKPLMFDTKWEYHLREHLATWLKKRGRHREATMNCLTSEVRSRMKLIFETLDADGGGSIDRQEIRGVLRLLGYKTTRQQVDKLMHKYCLADSVPDGVPDFHGGSDEVEVELDPESFTYMLLMEGQRNPYALENFPLLVQAYTMRKAVAAAVFQVLDKDNSGTLGRAEMAEAFKRSGFELTHDEFNKIFHKLDSDSSGEIDFEEFMQACSSLIADNTNAQPIKKTKEEKEQYDRHIAPALSNAPSQNHSPANSDRGDEWSGAIAVMKHNAVDEVIDELPHIVGNADDGASQCSDIDDCEGDQTHVILPSTSPPRHNHTNKTNGQRSRPGSQSKSK